MLAALIVATFGLPSVAALGQLPSASMIGYGHPESGNTTPTVNLTDTPRFTPRSIIATAGATLSVHLVNQGVYNHTFTLSKVPNVVLAGSWTPSELNSFFANNGSFANVSVGPGNSAWANVSFNASTGGDSFEFVSLIPYQFQAGMWGYVNLTTSGPGTELMDNTTDVPAFVPTVLAALPTHYPLVLDVLVTNLGNDAHTFSVSPLSNYTLSVNFTQTFATNPPLANQAIASGTGSVTWANFTVRGPGVYEYICTVTGHFQDGMTGLLYVGVIPPPPVPAPSTAVVESWVLAGSAVLLGVGIVLALVASYSGRFPSRPSGHDKHP